MVYLTQRYWPAGTQQALGYLLLEHSGRDILDSTRLPEALSEVVLLVCQDSISVYAPPEAHAQMQQILGPLAPHTLFLVPGAAEAASADALESFKIGAFVAMVQGCQCLSIPLSNGASSGHERLPTAKPMQVCPAR